MRDVFDAKYCSLHVRETNRAAIGLYRDTLGFTVNAVEKGYCEWSLSVGILRRSKTDRHNATHTLFCLYQTPMEKTLWLCDSICNEQRDSASSALVLVSISFILKTTIFSQCTISRNHNMLCTCHFVITRQTQRF